MKPSEIIKALEGFTGTENFYRSSGFMRNIVHTDGVQFLIETCQAFWLIDAIVRHQSNDRIRREKFQVWTLTKSDPVQTAICRATLTCTDGDGHRIARQYIRYTDFPLSTIKLYCTGPSPSWVIMLPNEY